MSVPRLGGPRVPFMCTRLWDAYVYKAPPDQRGREREGCSKVKFSDEVPIADPKILKRFSGSFYLFFFSSLSNANSTKDGRNV